VPSPVNFLVEESIDQRDSASPSKSEKSSEDPSTLVKSDKLEHESAEKDDKSVLVKTYSKLKLSENNEAIPSITSSESDTSSSEGDDVDDDEELSESSTNYNILDDTLSLLDPSSSDIENYPTFGESQIQFCQPSQLNFTSRTKMKKLLINSLFGIKKYTFLLII
jgi:hypothetical protein